MESLTKNKRIGKPDWLKVKLPSGKNSSDVLKNVEKHE